MYIWKPGNPVKQGHWHFRVRRGDDRHKVMIFSTSQNEYMYCADYKSEGRSYWKRCHVFTWRKGTSVRQGHFAILSPHESPPKYSSETWGVNILFRICHFFQLLWSVSSTYLDGILSRLLWCQGSRESEETSSPLLEEVKEHVTEPAEDTIALQYF